jgi:hypothetical protein
MTPRLYTLLFGLFLSVHCNTNKSELSHNAIDSSLESPKQKKPFDSLSKYSYLIGLYSSGKIDHVATGFFIKKASRLFFVSCNHVFTCQDCLNKKPYPFKFDSLKIFYNGYIDSVHAVAVDLRQIQKNSRPFYVDEEPDIYVYEISQDLIHEGAIYSIEKFLVPTLNISQVPNDVFSFGYGDTKSDNLDERTYFHFALQNTVDRPDTFYFGPEARMFVLKNSYLAIGQTTSGMSGSPVFWRIQKLNSGQPNERLIFGGVISSHFARANKELIVRPEEVTRLIDNLIAKRV